MNIFLAAGEGDDPRARIAEDPNDRAARREARDPVGSHAARVSQDVEKACMNFSRSLLARKTPILL